MDINNKSDQNNTCNNINYESNKKIGVVRGETCATFPLLRFLCFNNGEVF